MLNKEKIKIFKPKKKQFYFKYKRKGLVFVKNGLFFIFFILKIDVKHKNNKK